MSQAWPPFVLVAGLLLVGRVAAAEGLFESLGARAAATRVPPAGLLALLLALDALVTAVLNLDTAVVFLTPVLVHAARARSVDERPFLYGAVFMANAASLLLPGSNLTNLLILQSRPSDPAAFAGRMLLPWIAACAVTALVVGLAFRPGPGQPAIAATRSVRLGIGAVATIMAAAAVVALTDPAVPVLAIGLVATAAARVRPQLAVRSLSLLFCATVALGAAARHWPGAAVALASSGPWTTAVGAAATSVVVNNLPAAVLLSAAPPAHPAALLLGLDLGPNLAVTGSLSAVLWLQTARSIGARPSVLTYTRLGLLLVPASLVAALLALLAVRG